MIAPASRKTETVQAELRQRILAGEWKEGERLPTEAELAQSFECSVGTVSKAVALLVHDGLVERRPRIGIRVLSPVLGTPSPAKQDAFAFIYPSAQHESTWRMLEGFQSAAKEQSRRMVTLDTGVDFRRQAEYIGRLREFEVCGAVITPVLCSSQDYARFCNLVLKSSVPLVIAGMDLPGIACPAVHFDRFHVGYSAAAHLAERGAKNIGYLSNDALHSRGWFEGFRWALEERGLELREDLVLNDHSMHPNFEDPLKEPTQFAKHYLRGCGSEADGVVCINDYVALGLLRAARAAGRRVPEDLKIVGSDDIALAASGSTPLTTYRLPFEEAGRTAFTLLEDFVAGNLKGHELRRLRGRIIPRAST